MVDLVESTHSFGQNGYPTMRKIQIIVTAMLLVSTVVLADTYSCQQPNGARFASSAPCPGGSSTINVIRVAKPMSADYGSDARQLEEANRNRGNIPPSRMEPAQQQWGQQQPSQMQPTYRANPINKAQQCEDNWASVQAIDAAARVNSTEALRVERQRLLDIRWKLGC